MGETDPRYGVFFDRLHSEVGKRQRGILRRYYDDLCSITREAYRVLRAGRQATYVIGNSRIKGHEIRNCDLLVCAAKRSGFKVSDHRTRQIPENKRYMPLLGQSGNQFGKTNENRTYNHSCEMKLEE